MMWTLHLKLKLLTGIQSSLLFNMPPFLDILTSFVFWQTMEVMIYVLGMLISLANVDSNTQNGGVPPLALPLISNSLDAVRMFLLTFH